MRKAPPGRPTRTTGRDYGRAFARTAARIGDGVDRVLIENARVPALLRELLGEPPARRRERIRSEPRFRLVKLCHRLQAESREAWADDPARAVELAELAVAVAERLDVAAYGEGLVADTRALAWAYLGNALRIASDLRRADQALERAEDLCRSFGSDLLTEAEVLGFRASLRNTQGRFDEAARLLDRCFDLYREAGDRHQQGRTLILKGMVVGEGPRLREAIRLLRRGLDRIDPALEPRLVLAARHNLIWFLNDLGKHQEALALLEQSRSLYLEVGNRMHLARLRWLEGRIALGLGRLDAAERSLSITRGAFLEQEISFDAAMVSLDLAVVHARRGDAVAVKRIVSEIVPVFQACQVHPEAIAALLLFREASEAERVASGFLDRMATYLRRSRHNPELRFEG
ncbi:MAG: tetratricopeptide repeat protein [Acidobacteriota bacterium]